MNNKDILDFLIQTGLVWFFVLAMFFPIGVIFFLVAMKKLLLAGVGSYVKDIIAQMLASNLKHTEVLTKLEGSLEQLADQLKQIVANNWDTRRYLDDKFDALEERQKETNIKLETLITLTPKRHGDVA
jgi:hypothetical protein